MALVMLNLAQKYLRQKASRTIFCPGCGNGLIMEYFMNAADNLIKSGKLGLNKLVLVGGIGCSGWIATYLDVDVLHVLHGRALAVATGIKLANPELSVVVFSGDGDNLSIGGNHFIHAARRNIDVKVIMVNNMLYGMTGGQVSPTTPHEAVTHTTPYGNEEAPFDGCKLAQAAGATYVARWTTAHPAKAVTSFQEALLHRGFAYVEIASQCPIYFGRYIAGTARPSLILNYFLRNSVSIDQSGKESNEAGKFVIGKFTDINKPTFTDLLLEKHRSLASTSSQ
jgi:2-oxoglutarate ferredoxin oxidoreductase subunit beta